MNGLSHHNNSLLNAIHTVLGVKTPQIRKRLLILRLKIHPETILISGKVDFRAKKSLETDIT